MGGAVPELMIVGEVLCICIGMGWSVLWKDRGLGGGV